AEARRQRLGRMGVRIDQSRYDDCAAAVELLRLRPARGQSWRDSNDGATGDRDIGLDRSGIRRAHRIRGCAAEGPRRDVAWRDDERLRARLDAHWVRTGKLHASIGRTVHRPRSRSTLWLQFRIGINPSIYSPEVSGGGAPLGGGGVCCAKKLERL